jgi:putative protease
LKRVGFEFENRDEKKGNGLYVYVETTEQFDVSVLYSEVTRIYLDCNCQKEFWTNESFDCMIELAHKNKKEIFLAMPHIFRSHTIQLYEENYEKIFLKPWDGFLIRNIESFMFLREHQNKQPVITDHNLYQFNREAKKFWLEQGVESTTAPLELNYHELSKLGLESSEFVCYGYLPMMVSAQCIQKTTKGCTNEPGKLIFVDRYHKEFTVKNQCDYCYNVIYNTSPLVLTDQKTEIYKLSPKALRLHFTIENKEDTKRVLDLYKDVFVKNVGEQEPEFDFTRGHFKRGIK